MSARRLIHTAPAVRFTQNSQIFYATAVPAGKLLEISKVDEWQVEQEPADAGYQRSPSTDRLSKMARYIEREDALLPLGGLLNSRAAGDDAPIRFTPTGSPDQDGQQQGELAFYAGVDPLWVVDMQHRLFGIERAIEIDGREDLKGFPVVCTIADGLPKATEVEQFELINSTAKKVPTDLARRLLSMQLDDADKALALDERGKRWEARGPMIVQWLDRHSDIWSGAIIPPNKKKNQMPHGRTKENSFVTSLRPILETPLFQRTGDEVVAQLIDRYWQAVERIWPDAFEEPSSSVIFNTSGIYPLHRLMPTVFELARRGGETPSVDAMEEQMAGWRDLGDDFWAKSNPQGAARFGTSAAAFARIWAILNSALPTVELTV